MFLLKLFIKEARLMTNEESSHYQGDGKIERIVNHMINTESFGIDESDHPYHIDKSGNYILTSLYSKKFKKSLRRIAREHGDNLKVDDIKEVIEEISSEAEHEGEQNLQPYKRTAPYGLEYVKLDCANEDGSLYLVGGNEVATITNGSETHFQRTENMQPLPQIAEVGNWKLLLKFLNMASMEVYLFIAWLTYTIATPRSLHAGYPLLILLGSHGVGKSFLCKSIIRRFVDPVANPISVFPKNVKDMAIASQNNHLLIYDNIRSFSSDWSDILAILACGGTISTRGLYTNAEEFVLKLHSPVVLNGIHAFIKEADLADRCLTINLKRLSEESRKDEKALSDELDKLTPKIYRGLLDLTSQILAKRKSVEVIQKARMIDFSIWLAAMEECIDLEPGKLQVAYSQNVKLAMLDTLIEDPFAHAVLEFAKKNPEPEIWTGQPTQLFRLLSEGVPLKILGNAKAFPQNAISASLRLRTLEKALEAQGVILKLGERGRSRRISIGMKSSSPAS
mgnify:FL=1